LVEAEVLTKTTNTEKMCGYNFFIKTEAPPRLDFEN